MKRYLMIFAALLLVVCVAMPALAAVEFKYGGQFRTRFIVSNNTVDYTGTEDFSTLFWATTTNPRDPNFKTFNVDNPLIRLNVPNRPAQLISARDVLNAEHTGDTFAPNMQVRPNNNSRTDDHQNFIDERVRLYFTFIASENLKLVTKLEMGDARWGGDNAAGAGIGRVGADSVSIEVKNMYIDFNIPGSPVNFLVGTQGIALLNSWIIDDDFSAAVMKVKLDPVTVTAGYIGAVNADVTNERGNVDDGFLSVDVAQGPLKASLIGFYQNGHNTLVSIDPQTMFSPVGAGSQVFSGNGNFLSATPNGFSVDSKSGFGTANWFGTGKRVTARSNNLYDLAFNVTFKMDFMSAYLNAAKNLGNADLVIWNANNTVGQIQSAQYKGWMVDAGTNLYFGPLTAKVGGFYTSGAKMVQDTDPALRNNAAFQQLVNNPNIVNFGKIVDPRGDINWYVNPLGQAANFQSEIIGGGVTENREGNVVSNNFWRGYPYFTNVWTLTAGASYQCLEQTKFAASYWYWATSQKVAAGYDLSVPGQIKTVFSSDLGHEFNVSLTQGITDGLTLDLVGAYLIAGDALVVNLPVPGQKRINDDDAYELAMRLQWNF